MSARSASFTAISAWLAMVRSFCFSWSRSISMTIVVSISISTETSGHVIFRPFLFGTGENLRGWAELDQFAHVEKGCVIGCTRCLLHIMRNDDNRVVFS